MIEKNRLINPGGVNGTGKGVVNINSKDYKGLQRAIIEHAKQQSPEERMKYALISLRFQMESYLSQSSPDKIIEVGYYLKEHLKAIGISNKAFAKYIDIEDSNLSAIIKGRRKVNIDIAFKLGEVFELDPNLWLLIQGKNDLLKIDSQRRLKYKKYNLKELLQTTK